MDTQSLTNLLGILRLLNASSSKGGAAFQEIQKWAGKSIEDMQVLKVASYVMEQAALAGTVIENSQLSDEAKAGVLSTINGVKQAFSLKNGHTPWNAHVRDAPSAISNVVILLSALGIETEHELPKEAKDLIADVDAMILSFDDQELDPAVRDVAKRHLAIFSTLLKHIPVFGVEAALTTYFELVMKLRRADIGSTKEANNKIKPLFAKIKSWGEVLSTIDKSWNAGARLLEQAGKAKNLLEYIPDL